MIYMTSAKASLAVRIEIFTSWHVSMLLSRAVMQSQNSALHTYSFAVAFSVLNAANEKECNR